VSPADILAAARRSIVGPYLPARLEWLDGWCGPLTADVEHYGVGLSCIQAPGRHGPMMGLFEVHFRFGGIIMDVEVPLSTIRLDTRIPAVRDHLVRLGCPEWARDVPAAVWAWGSGVEVSDVITPWSDASDLAALNAGCILRVEGGWLVPLPGGGVGFFKEVSRDE
jgi:hypothetical protein